MCLRISVIKSVNWVRTWNELKTRTNSFTTVCNLFKSDCQVISFLRFAMSNLISFPIFGSHPHGHGHGHGHGHFSWKFLSKGEEQEDTFIQLG